MLAYRRRPSVGFRKRPPPRCTAVGQPRRCRDAGMARLAWGRASAASRVHWQPDGSVARCIVKYRACCGDRLVGACVSFSVKTELATHRHRAPGFQRTVARAALAREPGPVSHEAHAGHAGHLAAAPRATCCARCRACLPDCRVRMRFPPFPTAAAGARTRAPRGSAARSVSRRDSRLRPRRSTADRARCLQAVSLARLRPRPMVPPWRRRRGEAGRASRRGRATPARRTAQSTGEHASRPCARGPGPEGA